MKETWVPSLGQEDPVFLVNPMDRGGLVLVSAITVVVQSLSHV